MRDMLSIGANAPEFVVRADRGTLAPASAGQPRVVFHATGKRVRDLPITIDKLI